MGTDHSAISSVCASSEEAADCSHIETTSGRPGSLKAADSRSGYVQPYSDTPLDNVTLGENVYMNILKSATRYVYISTPYLIIDNEMEKELKLAAQRGVDVRIITPAIPDKKLVFLVTQSYYPSLIEAGVRIYQYTPGFIHAKGYVCDDKIGVVGTINMDYRSLYLHFECATYLYDCPSIMDMKADFLDTFEKSEKSDRTIATAVLFSSVVCNVYCDFFHPFFNGILPHFFMPHFSNRMEEIFLLI